MTPNRLQVPVGSPCVNPDVTGPYTPRFARRFWARVDRSGGPEACWPYTGRKDKDGYGFFGGENRRAHRIVCDMAAGRRIDNKLVVRHACHNPPCCNPKHLEPGTQAENARDALLAGRAYLGERNNRASLTALQAVAIIRRLRDCGWRRGMRGVIPAIARELGVSKAAVSGIAYFGNWSHLTPEVR